MRNEEPTMRLWERQWNHVAHGETMSYKTSIQYIKHLPRTVSNRQIIMTTLLMISVDTVSVFVIVRTLLDKSVANLQIRDDNTPLWLSAGKKSKH